MQRVKRSPALSITLTIMCGTPALAGDLTDGLVAYFPFEGTPYDGMNHCYDVTVLGDPSYERGAVGQGIRLDGIDDAVLVEHDGELSFGLDDESYSVSVYVKWDGSQSESQTVVQDRYGANVPVSYHLGFNGSTSELGGNSWYGNGTNYEVVTSSTPLSGQWHHVVVTHDHVAGLKSLYVDGVLMDSAVQPSEQFNDPENTRITIGAYWGSGGFLADWFDGMIDELRIYDRALSESEIDDLGDLKPCIGDANGDGVVNSLDVLFYLNAWTSGCQ